MARQCAALNLKKPVELGQELTLGPPLVLCKWGWKAGGVRKCEQEGWSSEKTEESTCGQQER